jgi:hypothetical protein
VRVHVEGPERRKEQDDDRAASHSGRQAGPVTAKKYGFAAVPQFVLARDGKVVADDPSKVTFTKEQIAEDQLTGKPVADVTTYDYRDGSSRYVLTYTHEKTILRQKFIEALRGIQRLAAHLVGFDGAYLRFSGKLELRHYEEGELTQTYSAPALRRASTSSPSSE